ncbi:HNH endonuclease signature motif containing protein [Streptomyces lydicus]|uniref:HNH endonuclease signature motif containing protein n=1 Tax=Streptomyces lydicus TaxID=47763 RepID=UPI001010F99D|nr:HNH endonuclease signature motif containing protein [Streptomyces lydicus]MCZ1009725.1 HNH endonuclease signature motif containing protein [Streptomyces lydicus]
MSDSIRYTRELLTEAARRCTNIDEVIAFCGSRSYHQLRRHLFRRFEHFGIDVSHFQPVARRATHLSPGRDDLQEAVSASSSIAAALRFLEKPDNSRGRALFRQWVSDHGIDTSHFLGQAHMRGKPGTTPVKGPEQILVKHVGKRRTRSVMLRRALRQAGVPERCTECGTGSVWRGNPMTLEIDHINGDWRDDRQENLRFLCPNCHAVTDTWCRGGRHRR